MQLNYPQQLVTFTLQRVSNDYSELSPIAQSMVQYNVKCHNVRPYTPGVICRFLGRTHQGLFVRFCPQTQQGLNVRFCIQTQQGLTVRYSRLYINSQTNCTYHINKSINLFHFHQNHPFLIIIQNHTEIHKITLPIFQMAFPKLFNRNFD